MLRELHRQTSAAQPGRAEPQLPETSQVSSSCQLFKIFQATKRILEKMQRGEKGDSEDDGARSKEKSVLISVAIRPVQSE